LIAFNEELEVWLNPELFLVESESPVMDPTILFDIVNQKLPPGYEIHDIPLFVEKGKSVYFSAMTGNDPLASLLQIFVDPHTGKILGQRNWGEISTDKKDLMPLINRIHFCLALEPFGSYLLGIIALFWTMDCFVGFYLTLPRPRTANLSLENKKSWLQRWLRAWKIKKNSSFIRFNFDLHTALGLWAWVALFIFAWSSVALNLPKEIYNPVTEFIFGMEQSQEPLVPPSNSLQPKLNWQDALKVAKEFMAKQALDNHFQIIREDNLSYDSNLNTYQYQVKSSLDSSKWATTKIIFDGNSGTLVKTAWPGSHEKLGDVITRWLIWLHMAVVFGIAMQIFVCMFGLVIVVITITGIVIWWKKRKARVFSKQKNLKMVGR
jgi:uncharacterized iron-regulated membrane protein